MTVSSTTSNLSLPFQALLSASDAALLSLLNSLRRELSLAHSSSNIRIAVLEIGFFSSPSAHGADAAVSPVATGARETGQQLSARLASIYAPALARRSLLAPSTASSLHSPATRITRAPSNPKLLHAKIFEIIAYGRGGSRSRVGAGSTSYAMLGRLPQGVVDGMFWAKDLVAKGFEGGRGRLGLGVANAAVGERLGGGEGGARPPLPQIPTQQRRTSATSSSSSQAPSQSQSQSNTRHSSVPRSNSTTSSASSTTNLLNSTISDQLSHSTPQLSTPHDAVPDAGSARGSVDGRGVGDSTEDLLAHSRAGEGGGGEFSFVGSEVDWRATGGN